MKQNKIIIEGARIHNLQGIDVTIPKQKLTVITGVSGSGKSSLAFDTLYEEGKRRYLLFSGTQFMIDSAPSFDAITGLSPTVAVEQRTIRQANPRSTVGTRMKLSPMLAALYANYGRRDEEYDDGLPLDVSMFQRNSAKGMCVRCLGKGVAHFLDEVSLFADKEQKIVEIACGLGKRADTKKLLTPFCEKYGIDMWNDRICDLTKEQLQLIKYGDGGKSKFCGFIPWITMLANGVLSTSGRMAHLLTQAGMMKKCKCQKCNGTGLGEQASHTYFCGKTIVELEDMYIGDLYEFLTLCGEKNALLQEITGRLACMIEVGLQHLALSRPLPTLSGGEIQRLFLAVYTVSQMDSIIFVFDEPTIGLHESEKENLIRILRKLVNQGNTVVVVEHDENFMREADYLIEIGPEAGSDGGRKIFEGTYEEFLECSQSKTAPYLRGTSLPVKTLLRPLKEQKLLIENASVHNLKHITAEIPLGVMVGVAGVSGSGKSSLILDTLVPLLKKYLQKNCVMEEEKGVQTFETGQAVLRGAEQLKKCYVIGQMPIGRSRTSCPATYTGIFERIRDLFAETEEAKARGYSAGMFSRNSHGRCLKCNGDGVVHYHVGFGNFIDVDCEECNGTGYVQEALQIKLEGKNICEILDMSVDEAYDFFRDKEDAICRVLEILQRVGMGYIKLGQATPTISGGESQRIKLAKELAKGKIPKGKGMEGILYILDEPTTGLSFSDEEKLLLLLNELVELGASIIVTEHDPFILSNCDYILEMGEGGGSDGGCLIASGTPTELKQNKDSMIGAYLK